MQAAIRCGSRWREFDLRSPPPPPGRVTFSLKVRIWSAWNEIRRSTSGIHTTIHAMAMD